MKYILLLLLTLCAVAPTANAQTASLASGSVRYTTSTGLITFFSTAPLEDIEALNRQVAAVFDLATGKLAFSLPSRGFQFKNSLMQEHFNENYAESARFPRARFTGELVSMPSEELLRSGPQPVQVQGHLYFHGVRRRVRVPGTLYMRNNELVVTAKFVMAPADYRIRIPALVRDNIAKTIDVSVMLSCTPTPVLTAAR
jgi:hypothetical protein